MNKINECPPLMVLAEESENQQLFRFRGKHWALITFMIGIILVAAATCLTIARKPEMLLLVSLYGFGLLLLHSTFYKLTADQWLVFAGIQRYRCDGGVNQGNRKIPGADGKTNQ